MNKNAEFKPFIEGKTIINQVRIRKQASLNLSENRQKTTSFSSELKKIQTCLPKNRRTSSKAVHLQKTVSVKSLRAALSIPSLPNHLTYDENPSTSKKTFHNERIFWKKRKLGNLPILLITFEGVLGKLSKTFIWSEERATFSFRDHHISGLSRLKREFYLVLICTYSRNTTKDLITTLEGKQSFFDAIYIQRHRTWHLRHVHDVEAILEDFQVTDRSKVLAVSAVGIDNEELSQRTGLDLIYENSASFKKKFLTYFSPTCEKETPVTVLIPHLGFNNLQTFADLSFFLIKLKKSEEDFFNVFEKSGCLKVKTRFEEKKPGKRNLPVHRFLVFNKENFKQLKPSTSNVQMRKMRRIKL
jgi:hypothetical protein